MLTIFSDPLIINQFFNTWDRYLSTHRLINSPYACHSHYASTLWCPSCSNIKAMTVYVQLLRMGCVMEETFTPLQILILFDPRRQSDLSRIPPHMPLLLHTQTENNTQCGNNWDKNWMNLVIYFIFFTLSDNRKAFNKIVFVYPFFFE